MTPSIRSALWPSGTRAQKSSKVWQPVRALVPMTSPSFARPSAAPDAVVFERELIVFPQRVPDPIVCQQDARQLRVAGEPHAAQVVDLALVPVGRAPQPRHRRHLRQLTRLVALPARQQQL